MARPTNADLDDARNAFRTLKSRDASAADWTALAERAQRLDLYDTAAMALRNRDRALAESKES